MTDLTREQIDYAAIAWALKKLRNFGVVDNNEENAHMADRLEAMLNLPEEAAEPAQPVVWMQSDHLNKFSQRQCGSQSMLARCADHKLMTDYVPLYTHTRPADGLVEFPELTNEMINQGARQVAEDVYHFGGASKLEHYSSSSIEKEHRKIVVAAYKGIKEAARALGGKHE
jgi:hypothetical protein